MTYKTTVTRTREVDGEERDVEIFVRVHYTANRAHRGMRDTLCGKRGAGPALEPDESASIDVENAIDIATGKAIDLSDSERETIENDIAEDLSDNGE